MSKHHRPHLSRQAQGNAARIASVAMRAFIDSPAFRVLARDEQMAVCDLADRLRRRTKRLLATAKA